MSQSSVGHGENVTERAAPWGRLIDSVGRSRNWPLSMVRTRSRSSFTCGTMRKVNKSSLLPLKSCLIGRMGARGKSSTLLMITESTSL